MKNADTKAHQSLSVLTEQDLRLLGARIAHRRQAKGWNQKRLALQASIEPGRLSRLERGKAVPRLLELVNLRRALGGTVDELLFEPVPITNEKLSHFLREVEQHASEEELQTIANLLQALSIGLRSVADNLGRRTC